MFSKTALEVTGNISSRYNRVQYYFLLDKTNDELLKANERLLNQQKQNFSQPDTGNLLSAGPGINDTLSANRKWLYHAAKVVQQSIIQQNNYVIIHRGSNQQLRNDLGVVDINNGVVGKIVETSENFSAIMSLLHKDSKVSAKLFKYPDVAGTIFWDGKTPNIVELIGIPKSLKVAKGDSVITSGLTATYPAGYMIGQVAEVSPDKSSSNYQIKIKTTVNFYNVQMVYAIDNLEQDEIKALEKKLEKKNH
ncbi:MAG: rod shape-determining protein MreC [Chitinophagaceae bacterium]